MMSKEISTLKDFQMISKLGQGSFAQVFKVKRKVDDQFYAMKKIRLTRLKEKDISNALNQIRILASKKSENIVQFKEAFYDQLSSTLCIIMQYASGGDLLKFIHSYNKKNLKIPQQLIWKALIQISKGLNYLHENRILHRDLKSANIFIDSEGMFKIGDLNVSKVLKQDLTKTQIGTPYYSSPQIWKHQAYDSKCDIWALGCLLYEMAVFKPPFLAKDIQSLEKKICSGYFPRIPHQYSNDLANIISKMLKVNPKQRPTASQLISSSNLCLSCSLSAKFTSSQKINLLQTIRFNPSQLKSINNILPKSQYQKQNLNQENVDIQNVESKQELNDGRKEDIANVAQSGSKYKCDEQKRIAIRQRFYSYRNKKNIPSSIEKCNKKQRPPLSLHRKQNKASSMPKVQPINRKLPQMTKFIPTRQSKRKLQNIINKPSLLQQLCSIKVNSRIAQVIQKNLNAFKQQIQR